MMQLEQRYAYQEVTSLRGKMFEAGYSWCAGQLCSLEPPCQHDRHRHRTCCAARCSEDTWRDVAVDRNIFRNPVVKTKEQGTGMNFRRSERILAISSQLATLLYQGRMPSTTKHLYSLGTSARQWRCRVLTGFQTKDQQFHFIVHPAQSPVFNKLPYILSSP